MSHLLLKIGLRREKFKLSIAFFHHLGGDRD